MYNILLRNMKHYTFPFRVFRVNKFKVTAILDLRVT